MSDSDSGDSFFESQAFIFFVSLGIGGIVFTLLLTFGTAMFVIVVIQRANAAGRASTNALQQRSSPPVSEIEMHGNPMARLSADAPQQGGSTRTLESHTANRTGGAEKQAQPGAVVELGVATETAPGGAARAGTISTAVDIEPPRRIDENGSFTQEEFIAHYGGVDEWNAALPVQKRQREAEEAEAEKSDY